METQDALRLRMRRQGFEPFFGPVDQRCTSYNSSDTRCVRLRIGDEIFAMWLGSVWIDHDRLHREALSRAFKAVAPAGVGKRSWLQRVFG